MTSADELHAPGTRAAIGKNTLLIVEGRDMYRFFLALLRQLGMDQQVEVRNGGGLPSFHDYFQDLVLISGFAGVSALGIARDCEDDSAVAFQQVCGGLQRAGLAVPSAPLTVTPLPTQPRIIVMLL